MCNVFGSDPGSCGGARDDGVRNDAIKGPRLASLEFFENTGSRGGARDDGVRSDAIKGPRLSLGFSGALH